MRTTLAVVVLTGLAAVLGAWGLVGALGSPLTESVVASAQARADEVGRSLTRAPTTPELPSEEDRAVHVLDDTGRVVALSPGAPAEPAAVPTGEPLTDVLSPLEGEQDERVVVVAERVSTDAGRLTVVVSQDVSDVQESQEALSGVLQAAVPVVVALTGLVAWWLVGRALAPVDAIRAEVQDITADRLDRRVPEPGTRDEVAELARTMNLMLDRLESAQRRQRQLVSDASHELRSPATAILQHAEVALSHPDRTTTEGLARVALVEGRRLEQLVEQMLWVSRSDEGDAGLRTDPVDLDDLVLEETARLRATSAVRIDTSRVSGGQVVGDVILLRRVVANLLDNAVGHAASVVTVELHEQAGPGGETVRLRVDDDGAGIAPADRERVLERFVRLDEARSRARGGTGLGLAIVAGVVHAHGGTLQVGESDSAGARFDVLLPTAP
ncbi:MAG: ATP-binding protein [Actinomycetota bacterium]|nr:ATP-binding protein [Actinomycetota bacterium]